MYFDFFQRRSLKTRISIFLLVIFLASLWTLAYAASRILRGDMQRLLGEQQFSTVSFIAEEINMELVDRLSMLESVAGTIDPAILDNTAALQAFLEQRPVLRRLFNDGSLAYRIDGSALAEIPLTSGRTGINRLSNDKMAALTLGGRPIIGRPVMDNKLGGAVFSMTAPIRDNLGKVVGALSGVTNLGKSNFLDMIAANRYGKSGGYLLIAPQYNLFVAASDKTRVMKPLPPPGTNPMHDKSMRGFEGYGIAVSSRGVEELSAVKRIPAAGWFLVVVLPTAEAFAPIYAMQQSMLLTTFLLTLLAGILIRWMLSRQLSPMLVAVETLTKLSEQSQPSMLLPITHHDEIGELIGGFNHLLETLEKREVALKESETRFRSFFEKNSSVMLLIEPVSGEIVAANIAAAAYYGYQPEQLVGMSINDINTLPPESIAEERQLAAREERNFFLFSHRVASGEVRDVEVYSTPIESSGRSLLFSIVHDITKRRQAEEKLHLAASVFTHAREGIIITSPDGTIIDVNNTFSSITGYSRDEALDQNPRLLKSKRQEAAFYEAMWRDLTTTGHWSGEIWNRHKSGKEYAELLTISAVRDAQGETRHYVALFSDITSLKSHQSQLEHIAHYDVLTDLPNRVLLASRLQQAMVQAQRRTQRLAVVFLDVDSFKAINERHGRDAGDQVLIALAARMKLILREGDTLARLGGDEFVAVLLDLADIEACAPLLTRLLAAAAEPVLVDDIVLQVSGSLGVTFYPQAEDVDADQLLRQADQSMYQAKLAGKNRYHVFDAEQDRSIRGYHESLEHVRSALAEHEFVLHYQPKVNMRTGEVVGAEALIRWQHPVKGLLPPAVFLPVIEDHPLAVELGEWVIDSALTQMELWRASGLDIPVSVNVGARQLQHADFVGRLREMLATHPNISPGDLELEVLETSALEDLARVSSVIEECREIGVMFALDDFGTGYSSLSYLKRLPVTLLKIDQSFVRGMLGDPDDLSILDGVLGLAIAFRRQVIAEGVETMEHGEMLLQLGCELAQGYGIARPMPAGEMPRWAATWRPFPSWRDSPAVSRDDLPLLYASVEHRAWIAAIESFLKGERDAPPQQNHHRCRFGAWLDFKGKERHSTQAAFQYIEQLHRDIHVRAGELLELHAQNRTPEALAGLGELHGLRDALLEQLKTLLQKNRQ